jgi:tetratricopeptide (TPR) repeat protein
MELRDGRIAEGTAVLQRILADEPGRRDALVILGCSVAAVNPDAGYECIEVAARAAIAADEWASAAAALNEFVTRVPYHIPALMRLVEICVDGGLEATMYSAQAQLADAYLFVGAGMEARVIAEDLVAREPWDRANIERFRRALTMLGETDVDGVIADRLSGQSPFTSTDFLWAVDPAGAEVTPMPIETEPVAPPLPAPFLAADPTETSDELPTERSGPVVPPDKSAAEAYAIDLSGILSADSLDEPQSSTRAKPESHEVDLSDILHDLHGEPEASKQGQPAASIENVLKELRDEAAHDSSPETAEQHFKLAGTYMEMGMQDEAMKALEVAARSSRHRFRAGAMLGKTYLQAGDRTKAIEWYGRAVEASAPSPHAHHALLYDLALLLEANGEGARALAVFLELQAEAGEYRDVSTRLEQLKVQLGR